MTELRAAVIGPTVVSYESCYACDRHEMVTVREPRGWYREGQCTHSRLGKARPIGGDDYKTPSWCPCKAKRGPKAGDAMQKTWTDGEKARPLTLSRPCECGCDGRTGDHGVGYLSGSTADGVGFTLWIETDEVFKAVEAVMAAHRR